MLFVAIIEPWETFICRVIWWPNISVRLLMKVRPPNVEPKGWGNNANKVNSTYL
jgi:hypothetical protein